MGGVAPHPCVPSSEANKEKQRGRHNGRCPAHTRPRRATTNERGGKTVGRGVEGWLTQPFTPPTDFRSAPPSLGWLGETLLQPPFHFIIPNVKFHIAARDLHTKWTAYSPPGMIFVVGHPRLFRIHRRSLRGA